MLIHSRIVSLVLSPEGLGQVDCIGDGSNSPPLSAEFAGSKSRAPREKALPGGFVMSMVSKPGSAVDGNQDGGGR